MNPFYPSVATLARHRCEYCRAPEAIFNAPFEVEHVCPVSRGGKSVLENLALACRHCNLWKSNILRVDDWPDSATAGIPGDVSLFNPRKDQWADHFEVVGHAIVGKTSSGRFTVLLLRMNAPRTIEARKHWAAIGLFP